MQRSSLARTVDLKCLPLDSRHGANTKEGGFALGTSEDPAVAGLRPEAADLPAVPDRPALRGLGGSRPLQDPGGRKAEEFPAENAHPKYFAGPAPGYQNRFAADASPAQD